MTSTNMPEADVAIDLSLVRALLQQQRHDLADLPLVSLAYMVGSADNPMMHNIGMRTLVAALKSD
jgi:hypothetical protein